MNLYQHLALLIIFSTFTTAAYLLHKRDSVIATILAALATVIAMVYALSQAVKFFLYLGTL